MGGQSYCACHEMSVGDARPSDVGFIVTHIRSEDCDKSGGIAVVNFPVPPGDVSSRTTSKLGSAVLLVVVTSASGTLGVNPPASAPAGPVCAANAMDDPLIGLGNDACQSNSRHRTWVPEAQVAEKSSGNASAVSLATGGGGAAWSGVTHAVRSKNMNSSAFSCAESGWLMHACGKCWLSRPQLFGSGAFGWLGGIAGFGGFFG